MRHIKAKYLDMVKSRVDICRLVLDMYPGSQRDKRVRNAVAYFTTSTRHPSC